MGSKFRATFPSMKIFLAKMNFCLHIQLIDQLPLKLQMPKARISVTPLFRKKKLSTSQSEIIANFSPQLQQRASNSAGALRSTNNLGTDANLMQLGQPHHVINKKTPEQIRPFKKAPPRAKRNNSKRIKTSVLTSNPVKQQLLADLKSRQLTKDKLSKGRRRTSVARNIIAVGKKRTKHFKN